ncbi:MAG: class I SAM-dependent methyltransferase [Rhodospirillales bacterium]|nr:class I SAM-dependent methyltransferase [Rhodospirillales bacterium]
MARSKPRPDVSRPARASPPPTTHFGFRAVGESEKAPLVRRVFDSVAGRYDLMNDLMSLGVHRLWKRALLDRLRPRATASLLDIGGGTGDVTMLWREAGGGPATVVDANPNMIAVGQKRAEERGLADGIKWTAGDAENLPCAGQSFDIATSAFCLRNLTRLPAALAEARRALKLGGRFVVLEFSRMSLPGLDRLYDAWSFKMLPLLGEKVAGDRDAYQYLAESIRRFPPQAEFARMLGEAGFERVGFHNLSGGIAALHWGWRL